VGRLLVFEEALVARSNRTAGIEIRHKKSCPSRDGGFCVCDPSYRAQVWSPSDGRFVRRTFRNLTEAIVWRDDARRGAARLAPRFIAGHHRPGRRRHRIKPSSVGGRNAPRVRDTAPVESSSLPMPPPQPSPS
jgi:hypothetical protein